MRQHERLVLATALRMTGNLEDAKDISQEVFLKLYRNLAKVEAPVALPAWLYRVTVMRVTICAAAVRPSRRSKWRTNW